MCCKWMRTRVIGIASSCVFVYLRGCSLLFEGPRLRNLLRKEKKKKKNSNLIYGL